MKLGIKADASVVLVSAPAGFRDTLEPLPEGVRFFQDAFPREDADVVVLFSRTRDDLLPSLRRVGPRLAPAGGLWVAWPKKASRLQSDLDFASVQSAGLELGLVDNKVCAIDDVFSGLRFVVRRENRQDWAAGRRI